MSGLARPGWRRPLLVAVAATAALVAVGAAGWWNGRAQLLERAPAPPVADAATLESIVAREPKNARAWALLGYQRAEQSRYAEAAQAFEQAVAHGPKIATDPAVLCEWADVLGMAQGGSLAGRPSELIARALALRPGHPQALEMAGSAAYERGDFTTAVQHWEALRPLLAADASRQQQLDAAIARAKRKAQTALPPG